MKLFKIPSDFDYLNLEAALTLPKEQPKAIIQFSHGMAEHKERYFDFMNFLAEHGYGCIIHDHRGHGESVKDKQDYGFFYTENEQAVIEDVYTVTKFIKRSFPKTHVYLFSHSMGTLVARGYLKKYDDQIEKLVLCGPPTYNAAAGAGIFLASILKHFKKDKASNPFLNNIAFAGFNGNYTIPNSWLSANEENVTNYNKDSKCGFVFTTNGFINLFKLQKQAFTTTGWQMKNKELPIYIIAGADDPVIRSEELFNNLTTFLKERGYTNITSKLYTGLRHEILNETTKEQVYKDVLEFFEG